MKWFPVDQDNILLSLPKVLITPHVAGATDITLQGMADDAEKVIVDFGAGQKPEGFDHGRQFFGVT